MMHVVAMTLSFPDSDAIQMPVSRAGFVYKLVVKLHYSYIESTMLHSSSLHPSAHTSFCDSMFQYSWA
jgi:hypothetical protein